MRKGVCKNGHILTDENSYRRKGNGCRECRICRRERDRRYRKRNRDRIREGYRIWDDGRRRQAGAKKYAPRVSRCPVGIGEVLQLPVEPFANWLRARTEELGGVRRAAAHFGISERAVSQMLNGHTTWVHIDTVDRCLLHESEFGALELLYPLEVLRAD